MDVSLILSSGTPAPPRSSLVEVLTESGVIRSDESSVCDGRQEIPLEGGSVLQPDDILGVFAAPLVRMPLNSLDRQLSETYPSDQDKHSPRWVDP